MERQLRRQSRRPKIKLISISMVSVAAIFLSIAKGPQLAKSVIQKTSTMMTLQSVEWEEVGTTNLSRLVTNDLLWKASGLKIGQEMLPIELDDVEKKLLEVPWLESVQLQKKLPSTLYVRYTTHNARALGLRKNRIWSVSSAGEWIAPLGKLHLDLPVITNPEALHLGLQWLETLETEFKGIQVHEISYASSRVTALIELKYPSRTSKLTLIAPDSPQADALIRLKRVVQYLIKNNILVSTIDLRPGKKVVVNVGK